MRVYLLSTGDELVRGRTTDLNAGTLARAVGELGYVVVGVSVVGDDEDALADAVRHGAAVADVVLMSGGLGPTEDDCTRRAVARVCGVPLERREELVQALRERYRLHARPMGESNLLQADLPRGAEALPNPVGTAPGFAVDVGAARLFALPGPPHELAVVFEREVRPRLAGRIGSRDRVVRTRSVETFGLPESRVGELLGELCRRDNAVQVGTTAQLGTIRVVLHATGEAEDVRCRLDRTERQVVERLGQAVFGRDGETLEQVVVGLLTERQLTLSTAESCTGGLVGAALTSVPGSSEVYPGGVVAYCAAEKRRALGVPEELVREHTAVSEPVAVSMAQGVRARTGSDLGLAVTGVAGPGPDADGHPAGRVWVALAWEDGATARRLDVPGARHFVRALATKAALDLARRHLSGALPS